MQYTEVTDGPCLRDESGRREETVKTQNSLDLGDRLEWCAQEKSEITLGWPMSRAGDSPCLGNGPAGRKSSRRGGEVEFTSRPEVRRGVGAQHRAQRSEGVGPRGQELGTHGAEAAAGASV